jgi:pyruvate formate lyase activating enzyme
MRVAEIQRFCTHDGPGLRTTVFFKGCPLRCVWCHNPETQKAAREVMLHTALCIGCGACISACPTGAQVLTQNDRCRVVSLCKSCFACADVCLTEACRTVGTDMSAKQILAEVMRDAAFYGQSGGVTLSGGEPLCADGVIELLQLCKQHGLHVLVETAGACDPDTIKAAVPYVDEFYFDIKHTDAQKHRELTGADPALILRNLAQIDQMGAKTRLRCLLVNGLTTDDAHFARVVGLYATLKHCRGVQLLRYHPMGGSKASALGLADSGRREWIPTDAQIARATEILLQQNVPVLTE